MASHVQRLIIPSGSDQFPLAALHFPPIVPPPSPVTSSTAARVSSKPPPAVLIAPATGVPSRFYLAYGKHLNESLGCAVLLFDYRYCGNSWPSGVGSHWSDLEGTDAGDEVPTGGVSRGKSRIKSLIEDAAEVTYGHWAKDCESALKFLIEQYGGDGRDIVFVANSVGGKSCSDGPSPEWPVTLWFTIPSKSNNPSLQKVSTGHLLPQIDPNVCKFVKRALYCGVFAPAHVLAPAHLEQAKRATWVNLVDEVSSASLYPLFGKTELSTIDQEIGLLFVEGRRFRS